MAPRSSFATEFLLRELLAALGAPVDATGAGSAPADSFIESLSEDTESQSAPGAAGGSQSRVMLVRSTNSSQHTVTLVDRQFDVEAFVPSHVTAALQRESGYQTLGRLRGSVVRVTKYHFATMARCLATDQQRRETSVSAPDVGRDRARVYLWVDALAIVDDNELAVKQQPDVYSHPLVAERLHTLSGAELEKQLMIYQGLLPVRTESDRFDDDRPLLEEDCVIPEDQEQELEEQDEWGPPSTTERQPTDSELIEENGSVPMTESQVVRVVVDKATQESVASLGNSSVSLSGNPSVSLSDEVSVRSSLDSQRFQFQQENIRETFVVGSDGESNDTEDEDDGTQGAHKSSHITLKSQRSGHYKMKHSSAPPALTTPKSLQSSCMVVDLTDDTPEKAPRTELTPNKNESHDHEPKTEAVDSQEGRDYVAAAHASSPGSCQSTETHKSSKGFVTRLKELFTGATDSHPRTLSSDEEGGDSAEGDQHATTQILDQPEEEEDEDRKENDEDMLAQPEEFISSQATVVLQYVDNDEDANAFEYEGVPSSDMASPRSVVREHDNHSGSNEHAWVHGETDSADALTMTAISADDLTLTADSAVVMTLTEKGVENTVTPEKSLLKDRGTKFKTPSPSTQAMTPGTEKKAEVSARQTPTILTRPVEDSEDLARGNSHPTSPPNSKDPVLPTDPSAQLSPTKSPSKLVIPVSDNNSSKIRTGFSTAESHGSKRRLQPEVSALTTNVERQRVASVVSQPQTQNDDQSRSSARKRRRREILSTQDALEGGSQSPQFEQPAVPFLSRRRLQSDRGNVIADSYSLDAVCQSLGSNSRDQESNAEENQVPASRQPRRAWKRYETLFPPLNMTRLKQMLAEGKDK